MELPTIKEISVPDKQEETYRVEFSQELGRHLVAARDLQKGEIIFREIPIASGLEGNSQLICPGCYNVTNTNCDHCGWPICGEMCPGESRHAIECVLLSRRKNVGTRDWKSLSDCLIIVRCLALKCTDPVKWRELLDMETNWDQWMRSSLYPRAAELIRGIRKDYNIDEDEFTTPEILHVQAALDINAYEVRMPDVNVQAIYALARLLEHTCVPNTHRTISSETLELTLRAAIDIKEGTHLTASYCDVLWPTLQRQQYLQWSKFFVCKCERCLDQSELGSHLSTLICPYCPGGRMPVFPILNHHIMELREPGTIWEPDFQCNSCKRVVKGGVCRENIEKAEEELQELDKEAILENCPAFENWLNKWSIPPAASCVANDMSSTEESNNERKLRFHSQHSMVLDACHTIFLLYSKEESSIHQLERKEKLGMHLLQATTKLFPGISKFHGTILYELALTKAAILAYKLEDLCKSTEPHKKKYLHQLGKDSLEMLRESVNLLQYEPTDQPEGILFERGMHQLDQFTKYLPRIIPDLNMQPSFTSSNDTTMPTYVSR